MSRKGDVAIVENRRLTHELGRKGLETRRRLMAAAHELLQNVSAVSLTATAIARHAKTSSATFYVYFDDVSDVVLALAREASEDLDDVRAVLADWRADVETERGARAFFETYRAYWNRHRVILNLRNMEADRGDERFLALRGSSGLSVIRELADVIQQGHPDGSLSEDQSLARATVIFAAIERLAASAPLYPSEPPVRRGATTTALTEAQIAMLVSLVRQ